MKKLIALAVCICGIFCHCSSQQNKYQTIKSSEFEKLTKDSTVQILDVRTQDEYKSGHIKNAINIDISNPQFDRLIDEKINKNHPVAIYCRSGRRSANASGKLSAKGYTVYNLADGIIGWAESGYPSENY